MSADSISRRMIRRETHSSRALASSICAVLVAGVFLWLAAEIVLWLVRGPAVIAGPAQLLPWLTDLPVRTIPAGLAAAGAGLGLLGLLLLGLAFGRGRKARRALSSDRSAVVVDDEVIAAVSGKTRQVAGLAPGQVTTTVGGRSVRVRVRPTSGIALDPDAIRKAVDDELAAYGMAGPFTSSVKVASQGAVGQ